MSSLQIPAAGQRRAALISACVTLATICVSILSSAGQAVAIPAPPHLTMPLYPRSTAAAAAADDDDDEAQAVRGAAVVARRRPSPTQHLARQVFHARQSRESTSTTSPAATPTESNNPNDNNTRPTAALSIFTYIIGCPIQDPSLREPPPPSPSLQSEERRRGGDDLLATPRMLRRQQTSVTSSSSSSTNTPAQTSGGGSNTGYNSPNLPAPFLSFAVAAIALFVLVVAFVLLRIFVRNRRLRRLGLLPGDLTGSRLLGPAREIEDTLTPPKLWEAKIADLEEVQKLRSTRAAPMTKIQDWEGIMPIAAAFPTQLYAELHPDATKPDRKTATTYPPNSTAGGAQGGTTSSGRGLRRLLRLSGGHQSALPNGNGPASTEAAEGSNASKAGAEDPTQVAGNEVPIPAAVNVTVLIAMPSPKTVFPSARQMKAKKSTLSFVSALSASASKPSLIPAQLSTTKVDEVDEEYLVEVKGKSRREPSLRSVRTGVSATSFAEARREAFFKSEAGVDEMELPEPDHRSEYGFDADEDEEEELPELMFGTASVPIYRDWATTHGSSSSSVPVPEDLIIPTKADLLQLLNSARQVKERKTLDAVAQLKAAAAKEEMAEQDGDGARGDSADDAAPLPPAFGNAPSSASAGAELGTNAERRSSLTTLDVAESPIHPRFSGVGRPLLDDGAAGAGAADNRQSMGTASVHGRAGSFGDALSGIINNTSEGRNLSLDDPDRRRGSWLSREANGFSTTHGYASTSQANLEARSTHTDDGLLHTAASTQNEHATANQ